MKDVVERLRNPMVTYSEGVLLMEEAADEIERLREQNRKACAVLHAYDQRLIKEVIGEDNHG